MFVYVNVDNNFHDLMCKFLNVDVVITLRLFFFQMKYKPTQHHPDTFLSLNYSIMKGAPWA